MEKNTWMSNPQYLAQIGHSLGGCLIIVLTAFFFGAHSIVPSLIALSIGIGAAAVKEFWYDMKYELPKQTWADSGMDFGFYVLGGVVGLGLAMLKLWVV